MLMRKFASIIVPAVLLDLGSQVPLAKNVQFLHCDGCRLGGHFLSLMWRTLAKQNERTARSCPDPMPFGLALLETAADRLYSPPMHKMGRSLGGRWQLSEKTRRPVRLAVDPIGRSSLTLRLVRKTVNGKSAIK